VDVDGLLDRIDTTPGCSVKDSFSTLDLCPAGFSVLFEASWLHVPPPPSRDSPWRRVGDAEELEAWVLAAGLPRGLLRPALLDDPRVTVLRTPELAAGAVLNRSQGVVGVTNAFGRTGATLLDALGTFAPGLAVVGYEDDPPHPVGALRVWVL